MCRGSHPWENLHVWGQQVCCGEWFYSTSQVEQEAQWPLLSPCQIKCCCWCPFLQLDSRVHQPGWRAKQTLGLPSSLAFPQTTLVLARWHHGSCWWEGTNLVGNCVCYLFVIVFHATTKVGPCNRPQDVKELWCGMHLLFVADAHLLFWPGNLEKFRTNGEWQDLHRPINLDRVNRICSHFYRYLTLSTCEHLNLNAVESRCCWRENKHNLESLLELERISNW